MPEFQDTYHGFLYFLTFLVFLSGFFILLVREKHRKTLYRFLFAKNKKDGIRTTGIKPLNTTTTTKINGRKNNDSTGKWVSKRREFTILLLQITEK